VRSLWSLIALALSTGVPGALPAQDQPALEEIIVTAEAREEELQDVPVAVTAFSAGEIQAAGIESTSDFIALTPNVTFDDSFTVGNSFVTVRGVAQINNADSPMAIVIDGVPQNNQKQFKMDLYDIERIEVVKGPQGALYGRNAIGGAVVIATRPPTDEFESYLQVGAGNGGFIRANAAISGPLVEDSLFFRLAGSFKESDGLIRNTYLGEKVDFYDSGDVRGKLTWFATENLIVDFRIASSRLDGGAIYDVAFFDDTGPENTNTEQSPVTDILGDSERDIDELTLKLDWLVAGGTFTSITASTHVKEDYYGDLDFCNPVDCPDGLFGFGQVDQTQSLDVEMLSQEFRFTSPGDEPFRWLAGAYLLDTQRDLDALATLVDLGGFPVVDSFEKNDNLAWAVFGKVDYDFDERWEISASLRYDDDTRDQTDALTGTSRKISFDAWQPKATLTWHFTDDQLLYATYAKGFRSGGFNGIGGRAFQDETVDNYEIGYKSTHLNRRLRVNAAAFHSQSHDFQFFFVDLNAGGAQVIDNLDKVSLEGFEVETEALITDTWRVFGGVGLLDSSIDAFDPDLTVPAQIGNKSPKTTDYTFNVGTQIDFPLGPLTGSIRADYERRGDRYWHPDNVDVMGPVSLLGLRASVHGESWTLTLWGRNISDEFYYEDFNAVPFTGLPWNIGFPAKPDTYGVDFRYDF